MAFTHSDFTSNLTMMADWPSMTFSVPLTSYLASIVKCLRWLVPRGSLAKKRPTMGVAVGTVKSRASRARKRLSLLMGLAEGEDVLSGVGQAELAVMSRSGMQAA
jgi:hypothetical protein